MRSWMMAAVLAVGVLAVDLLACGALPAAAQTPVKIGMLVTLSGPGAVLGAQVRDGFLLALKQRGGKLGGHPAELVVVDDELKPDVAVSRAKRLIESDKVSFVVGPIFSNILGAIFKPVTQGGAILISPNAGSSVFAGKQCSPDFFVTSYENNQVHSVLGEYAQRKGYKRAFLLAPNYQAGKDAVAGFKSRFHGEIVAEDYVPLTQLDFQADLARIADARPDVIFTFMPGGLGVALVKQFHQSGLAEHIPFLSAFTVDESTLPAQQDAALGLFGAMTWAPNMDNSANKTFVDGYLAAYHAMPGSYAMQAYDAAQLIDSALAKVGDDTGDKDSLHAALRAANFASPRGAFHFNRNGYPIQDFYLVKAAKRADGLYETEIAEKVFSDYADSAVDQCPLH